jgi:hypothetical protein
MIDWVAWEKSPLLDNSQFHATPKGAPFKAEIETGYQTSVVCHLGNISARVGRSLSFDPIKEKILGDDEANRLLGREYRSSHWGTPKGLV